MTDKQKKNQIKLRNKIWNLFTKSINSLGGPAGDVWFDYYSKDAKKELNKLLGVKEDE